MVQELFGNKKYPYGKASKNNPRGKRDQAELDRAQAYLKKKQEPKKAQKADDAGARAKRLLQRKVHAKYVSGSEDLVPDEMRD